MGSPGELRVSPVPVVLRKLILGGRHPRGMPFEYDNLCKYMPKCMVCPGPDLPWTKTRREACMTGPQAGREHG